MPLKFNSLLSNSSFQYYTDSHGVLYVIDSSEKSRIDESFSVLGKLILITQDPIENSVYMYILYD